MDLLDVLQPDQAPIPIGPGAVLLPGFAVAAAGLMRDIRTIEAASPFRHLLTPGGSTMSVAMTNSGRLGWVSDRRGYRYEPLDPLTGRPWPPLPQAFLALAAEAAICAGHAALLPDCCLVNRYAPGARLSLHQDRDEPALSAPIVSVSLGLPATFLFGGLSRGDPVRRIRLAHGDVAVWGGPSRLAFHGIAPLRPGHHPATGDYRFNLTFRLASRLPCCPAASASAR